MDKGLGQGHILVINPVKRYPGLDSLGKIESYDRRNRLELQPNLRPGLKIKFGVTVFKGWNKT